MRELVALLQSGDIKVIVTLAPESAWFIRTSYHGEREESARYLADLAAREGLIYADLSRSPYDLPDSEFFEGSIHVGPRGAERLSRLVVAHLVVPALAGTEDRQP